MITKIDDLFYKFLEMVRRFPGHHQKYLRFLIVHAVQVWNDVFEHSDFVYLVRNLFFNEVL